MNISDLIIQLQQLDVRLFVEDGRLRVNAPKGLLTPELRETLAARKEEIIAFLQTARPAGIPFFRAIKIEPAEREGNPPLSFAQLRLWFLDQYDPGGTAYAIPSTIRYEGKLDIAVLEKCLNEIIRRHESLRTSFATGSRTNPRADSPRTGPISVRMVCTMNGRSAGTRSSASR